MSTKKSTASDTDILQKEDSSQLPLVKINFILMAIAALMIVLGFILISGVRLKAPTSSTPKCSAHAVLS